MLRHCLQDDVEVHRIVIARLAPGGCRRFLCGKDAFLMLYSGWRGSGEVCRYVPEVVSFV
jgi:hypothetical protein